MKDYRKLSLLNLPKLLPSTKIQIYWINTTFTFPAKISREIVTMNRYDCRASPPHAKSKRASPAKRDSLVNPGSHEQPLGLPPPFLSDYPLPRQKYFPENVGDGERKQNVPKIFPKPI